MDDFLDGFFPPREGKKDQKEEEDEAAPLLQNPDTPGCPRCHVLLEYHESPRSDGTVWRYVRCPESKFFTKCFMTSGVENQLGTYLAKVQHQLHEAYRHTPRSLDMAQLRIDPHRLYFKCPQGTCSFFQWGDQPPSGKVERWLEHGIHPDRCPERRRPPSPLYALGTRREAPLSTSDGPWLANVDCTESTNRERAVGARTRRSKTWTPLRLVHCRPHHARQRV